MTPTTRDRLLSNVRHWVDILEGRFDQDEWGGDEEQPVGLSDILAEAALDIEIRADLMGHTYRSARVTVASGGPTVWIDTRSGTVQGVWGDEEVIRAYRDALGLDEYIEELCMTHNDLRIRTMTFAVTATRTRTTPEGHQLTSMLPTFTVTATSDAGARKLALAILLDGTTSCEVHLDVQEI